MERTILTGAMLIDGSGAPPAAGRAVVVQNGRTAGVVAERDAPAGTPLNAHGSMVPELELMVKAGMARRPRSMPPPPPACWASSVRPGRVAPGLAADLLAVAGNPAERIAALDEVRLVMAQGRLIVNRT
jgi:hypothetical protein